MYEQAQTQGHRRWAQFSLRALMIGVTIFSVLLALTMVPPLLAMAVGAMYIGLTGVLAIAIWQGRGWIRAFSVGAMLPHLSGYPLALASRRPTELILMAVVIVAVSCLSGIFAAAFHGALARRNGTLPIPNLPLLRNWFTND